MIIICSEPFSYQERNHLFKAVLESGGEYVVSGAYKNVTDIEAIIKLEEPDLVILDAGLPGGVVAISQIKNVRPETLILTYTSVLDEEKNRDENKHLEELLFGVQNLEKLNKLCKLYMNKLMVLTC